jgi:hypothetical protein
LSLSVALPCRRRLPIMVMRKSVEGKDADRPEHGLQR